MNTQNTYNDPEIAKFDRLAEKWWDLNGELSTLHELNPVRLEFIQQNVQLTGKKVLDVGCGGGILSESLAKQGAHVTAIDLAPSLIQVAKEHALQEGLNINYQCIDLETFAAQNTEKFDCITCMELLEHVPNPPFFIQQLSHLITDNGQLFFSTINRTLKAYMLAIIGAEYILNILPKKTHDYAKFIKPSELATWLRDAGLKLTSITGVSYNPLTHKASITKDVGVNYMVGASL